MTIRLMKEGGTMKKREGMEITAIFMVLFLTSLFVFCPINVVAKTPMDQDLIYLTEQYPPFNYEEKGRIQGITVDLLEEIWKKNKLGLSREQIRLRSWTAGYQAALKKKNTVLFSMTRIPEREKLFQWAGPIAPTKVTVIARKDRSVRMEKISDLRRYRIAVIRDDIGEQILVKRGIKRKAIIVKEKAQDIIRLMEEGAIDAWVYEETAGLWLIKHMAANPANYESVCPLYEGELYFAFNRKTPKAAVQSFQQSLDDLKKEKTRDGFSVYERIFDNYLKPRYVMDVITNEQATRRVEETAADLAIDVSGTIKKINAGEHPYRDKDNRALYVFIYDTDGTMIAHGDNIKLVGKNFKGKTDVNGKAFRDEILAKAIQNGSGWEDYVYTNPGESGLYYKTTYFKLVKGSDGKDYIVCCGKFKDKP